MNRVLIIAYSIPDEYFKPVFYLKKKPILPYHFFFLDVFLPENRSFFDKIQLYNSMFLISSA